jgi:hypothetical protein
VLVGHKKTVAIAVRNVSGRRRWSKLARQQAFQPRHPMMQDTSVPKNT